MSTTARDMPSRCTDYHKELINLLQNNMRPTSTTMKPKLQPYSPDELRIIAGQIEEYRRSLREEYAWEDHEGKVHVEERMLRGVHNEALHAIAKDLYLHGARQQKGKTRLALQVIGETICKEDPR